MRFETSISKDSSFVLNIHVFYHFQHRCLISVDPNKKVNHWKFFTVRMKMTESISVTHPT